MYAALSCSGSHAQNAFLPLHLGFSAGFFLLQKNCYGKPLLRLANMSEAKKEEEGL